MAPIVSQETDCLQGRCGEKTTAANWPTMPSPAPWSHGICLKKTLVLLAFHA